MSVGSGSRASITSRTNSTAPAVLFWKNEPPVILTVTAVGTAYARGGPAPRVGLRGRDEVAERIDAAISELGKRGG